MPNNPVRFGMVGAGGIAQSYAAAFRECSFAKLVAVADVRADAAQAIAQTLNAASYSTHQEMCDKEQLDAVIVVTPPNIHADIVTDLLHRKLHVLCEKPLTVDSTTARNMFAVADEVDRRLTMATKFRFADDVVRAKSLISSGILGDIILFENTFTARVDMSSRWNSNPAVSGGGVLIDNGTHSVDIVRYLLGPITELQVIEGRRVQNLPVEDTVRMFVHTTSGANASIDLSWSINKEQPNYISVYGSQGTVHVGWKESKYRRSQDDAWIVFGQGYNKVQAFKGQIENFARAVKGQDKLLVTADDAIASVEVIEAAYRALVHTQWEPVTLECCGSTQPSIKNERVSATPAALTV